MLRITVAVFFAFALPAWTQNRVGPPTLASPGPAWDKGFIEDRTYKNSSIGLQLTTAPGLKLGTPELKGKPGTLPLLVTVAAWGNQKWFGAREGTVFYAEALASYPEDQRSTDAYMEKVVSSNRTDGFAPVKASLDNLGRVQFERTDFRKGSVYEAALVKSCDTLALVLFFTSADRNTTDRLIAATDLKLDLAHSGCMIKARKN